jgi:hypothetical protein
MQENFSINESFDNQLPHTFKATSGEFYEIQDNNSSYNSTNVISFDTIQITNSLRYADYKQSYISIPFIQRTTVRDANGGIPAIADKDNIPKFNCFDQSGLNNPMSLKNSALSTVSYCSVIINNYQISQASSASSSAQLLHNIESKANADFVNKNVNNLLYYPDDHSSNKYVLKANSTGLGMGDVSSCTSNIVPNARGRSTVLQETENKSRSQRIRQIPVILIGEDTQALSISEFQNSCGNSDNAIATLKEISSSYCEISDYSITTYYMLRLPLRFLASVFESIPLCQHLGLKLTVELHHRSSTLVKYTKAGLITDYIPSSITGCIPFQLSSPEMLNSLDADPTITNNNVFYMRYDGTLNTTALPFSLYTTFDIAKSSQPFIDSNFNSVTKDHYESRCKLNVYLMTLTEQVRQEYEQSPFKPVRYNSVYSERSSIIVESRSDSTISISNIGFSFLRYALVFLYAVPMSTSTPLTPAAGDLTQGIAAIESHFSDAPMSSSRCTLSGIQCTLSSSNLYSQTQNTQHLNYRVLNSNSYNSGMELNTASGQFSEYMYNQCPVIVIDLSKKEQTTDAVTRTIQIKMKNLSSVRLQPYFYLFYEEALNLNVVSGEIQQIPVQ